MHIVKIVKVPQLSPWNVHTSLHLQDDSGWCNQIVFRGTGTVGTCIDGQVARLQEHLGHAEMFAMLVWSLEKRQCHATNGYMLISWAGILRWLHFVTMWIIEGAPILTRFVEGTQYLKSTLPHKRK